MKYFLHVTIFMVATLFYSCNIINPAEEIPTYIQIDSVQVKPTLTSKHGSVNHKITDVWVYYNRDIVGPFELPARIPILAKDQGQIQILAGIYQDGLSVTRIRYPFFTVDTFSFKASPAEIIKHTPIFNYRTADTPGISYLIEDFEQGNIFAKRYNNDTTVVRTNTAGEVFEGDWSGLIRFNDTMDNAESITSQSYNLPPNREAYLEINYKSDLAFDIGTEILYQGTYVNTTIISLKSTKQWNKVYVKLGGFADTFQGGSFKFAFKVNKPSGVGSASVYLDNFKIIYYN
jgi:hypothetical protein